jgi:transcriptional regulator with XRE-family HTH domain
MRKYEPAELGKRIKDLLNEKNMRQSDLAASLNFTDSYISLVIAGHRELTISTLDRLSEIFDVSLDHLVYGE